MLMTLVYIANGVVIGIENSSDIPTLSPLIKILDVTYREEVIEVGYLYDGVLDVFTEPTYIIPEPELSPIPVETTEQKLERVLKQLDAQQLQMEMQQQQNLILLDVNMTIYEELLTMQERLSNA